MGIGEMVEGVVVLEGEVVFWVVELFEFFVCFVGVVEVFEEIDEFDLEVDVIGEKLVECFY